MRTTLLSTAALAAVLILSGTAVADPVSKQDKISRELAEAEATLEGATEAAKEAGRELTRVEGELPGAQDRVATATGLVAAAKALANAAEAAAEVARSEHATAVDVFDGAEADVTVARDELTNIAVLSYQGAPLRGFNGVLNADNPFDAVESMSYVKSFLREQSEALDTVLILRQDAKVAQNGAATTKAAAEEAELAAATALDAAETEQENAERAESELADLIDSKAAALDTAETERDASLARYEEAKAASERIAAQLQNVGNQNSSSMNASEAGFTMPVNGWKSSDFGNRYDPYYHVWQLHAGTDFAAGGGEAIRAVAAGEVVQAGWNGGYGNYTCIYHRDNIATCYAHQSSIGVSVGQRVGQGEQIGQVGTTGASTGNHLHFEVRVSGSPVEPLDWLPGCLC
ncbi:M23 family metallopeptidase [Stackebrandtia soli]|uniref:M23 family metallopeptidase n=1 Tax=Stackebrandtia soli TaxID=1892856 RepID=UPI0039EAB4A7